MSRAIRKRWVLRRFWDEEKGGLVWVVILALCIQFVDYHGWLATPEGRLIDWFLKSIRREESNRPRIVTVEIDDHADKLVFGEQSPLCPRIVLQLVEYLKQARPAVIGVDILTDAPDYRGDAARCQGPAPERCVQPRCAPAEADSARARSSPEVVWASGADKPKPERGAFPCWLAGCCTDRLFVQPTRVLGYDPGEPALGETVWGLTVSLSDEDLRVRRAARNVEIAGGEDHRGSPEPGPIWTAKIAELYCHSHDCRVDEHNAREEAFVPYWPQIVWRYNVCDQSAAPGLFACPPEGTLGPMDTSKWDEFQSIAKGSIVLIGGTFARSNDFHETPIGRIPGLLINAYAIQAEIRHTYVSEVPPLWEFVFDLVFGLAIVFVFWYRRFWLTAAVPALVLAGFALLVRLEWPLISVAILAVLAGLALWARKLSDIQRLILLSFTLIPVAGCLSVEFFLKNYVWLSGMGVAAGLMPHVILEIWRMFPKVRHKH